MAAISHKNVKKNENEGTGISPETPAIEPLLVSGKSGYRTLPPHAAPSYIRLDRLLMQSPLKDSR